MSSQVLNELCFLCLSHHENLHSIRCTDKNGLVMKEKLTCFLFDHINFVPNHEKFICDNCMRSVNNIYQYRESCVQNIKALNDYLQTGTIKGDISKKLSKSLDIIHNKKIQSSISKENFIDESSLRINNTRSCDTFEVSEKQELKEELTIFDDDIEIKDETIVFEDHSIEIEEKHLIDCDIPLKEIVSNPILSPSISEEQNQKSTQNEDCDSDASFNNIHIKQENVEGTLQDIDPLESEKMNTAAHCCVYLNCDIIEEEQYVLPEKSKSIYEKVYTSFKNWCSTKNNPKISENVLLVYFQEQARIKKPSSLWATYSMLKSTLLLKENISISKYFKITAFLKRQNNSYKPKKSSVFSKEEITKFLEEAPDEKFLSTKAILVIGVAGACRNHELCNMQTKDIGVRDDIIIINIPKSKNGSSRKFVLAEPLWIEAVKKYLGNRPNPDMPKVFIGFRHGKPTRQNIGHNTISKVPRTVATFLKLKNLQDFTGYSIRRTSENIFRRQGGWRTGTVAEECIEESLSDKNVIYDPVPSSYSSKSPVLEPTELKIPISPLDPDDSSSSSSILTGDDATLNALPEVTRKRYEVMYRRFMDWKKDNKIDSYTEDDIMKYFEELAQNLKSSTLWAQYSMLRSTLSAKKQVDISFFPKLRAFLKEKACGYVAKRTKTLTTSEILRFINEAPDVKYLLVKVVLVIGITGACRRDELCYLKQEHMQDMGSSFVVKIPDAKTRVLRQFTITGNFYKLCKKYASLRPLGLVEKRFFLNYQHGKCTRQVVGINKLGTMPREIAKFLKLPNPELYTGHCFRRSSTTLRVDVRD